MNKRTRTQKALANLDAALEALERAIALDYPIGSMIKYRHGSIWIPCIIVSGPTNDGSRIRVRGIRSDKEYWIQSTSLEGGSLYR